jgi:hypothetical protein
VTKAQEMLDNFALVLGKDTGETIGTCNHLVEKHVLAAGRSVFENPCGTHVVTEIKTKTSFLCNAQLTISNDLDLDAERNSIVNGLLLVPSLEDRR